MTQDEKWLTRYNEVKSFIEENHRNPSKYVPEEKLMVHFLKRDRKHMNAGEMKEERVEKFKKLLELAERWNYLSCQKQKLSSKIYRKKISAQSQLALSYKKSAEINSVLWL